MYVKANIQLHVNGCTEDYQVGADVTCDVGGLGWAPYHDVGEPDVSAPGCPVATSRLADLDELPDGWSEVAKEALVQAYVELDHKLLLGQS